MRNFIFLLLICFFGGFLSGQTTITYLPTDDIFANPERGLQKYSITNNSYNTTAGYSNLNQSTLTGWRTGSDKVTVIFRYFLLNNFLNADISTVYLQNIQKDFDIIRASGLKCIVRFSYSNAQSSAAQQPSKSFILKHISQLSPLLFANRDVIFSHQAGFLGTWGEWYYTNATEFGSEDVITPSQWAARKEIIDAMLQATPEEIPLQVRYPEIKMTMYGKTPLTEETAYKNTALARIGFFNDAFLNKWGDMGTYSVSASGTNPVGTPDYVYLSNETQFTPMTGETNGLNSPRTGGENAVFEMNATNWTTLNRDYYTQNFNNWISSGHYPAILKGLGYRFVLEQGTFSWVNNALNLELKLSNQGFARLVKPRPVIFLLKHVTSGRKYTFPFQTDPRKWSDKVIVNQSFVVDTLPEGTYSCHLFLPDSSSVLSGRPEYAIRFANQQLWNETDGSNNLNFSFQIPLTSGLIAPGLIVDQSNQGFSIYQFRKSEKAFIPLNGQAHVPSSITILDLSGRLIKKYSTENQPDNFDCLSVDISSLNPGLYLISIRNRNGHQKCGLRILP